jgi:hypothetical protein
MENDLHNRQQVRRLHHVRPRRVAVAIRMLKNGIVVEFKVVGFDIGTSPTARQRIAVLGCGRSF